MRRNGGEQKKRTESVERVSHVSHLEPWSLGVSALSGVDAGALRRETLDPVGSGRLKLEDRRITLHNPTLP